MDTCTFVQGAQKSATFPLPIRFVEHFRIHRDPRTRTRGDQRRHPILGSFACRRAQITLTLTRVHDKKVMSHAALGSDLRSQKS
jgi:hypothetical protein